MGMNFAHNKSQVHTHDVSFIDRASRKLSRGGGGISSKIWGIGTSVDLNTERRDIK